MITFYNCRFGVIKMMFYIINLYSAHNHWLITYFAIHSKIYNKCTICCILNTTKIIN